MEAYDRPCEKCGKPLKRFTSAKRTNRNYKDRPLHLKCWKENEKEINFLDLMKNIGKL